VDDADDSFVVIGRESYFIRLFCGEIVFATSNDIHCPQHFFSWEQNVLDHLSFVQRWQFMLWWFVKKSKLSRC